MIAKEMGHAPGVPRPFGQIVVDRGLATRAQIDKALRAQRESDERGEPHKLIGIVLLEMGIISSTQLIQILKEYEQGRPQKA